MNDLFTEMFPHSSTRELCDYFGISPASVSRLARRLNLTKNPDYISEIQRQRTINRKLSEESRTKIANKAKGRNVTSETTAKILATKIANDTLLKGEKHPNWKGGKPWERFKDPAYIQWRNSVLERDNYVCQQCFRQCKKYERGLAAHHIQSYRDHANLRLDIANGMTLCRDCHMTHHKKNRKPVEKILCKCGCGTIISSKDRYDRSREFVNGHGCRKLTDVQKNEIRQSSDTRTVLAERYGVNPALISKIRPSPARPNFRQRALMHSQSVTSMPVGDISIPP